jgi:hypothetical protein
MQSCRIGKYLYFCNGGCYIKDGPTFIYNSSTNSLEYLPESNGNRFYGGCALRNNEIFTFGGGSIRDGSINDTCEVFDLETKTWRQEEMFLNADVSHHS